MERGIKSINPKIDSCCKRTLLPFSAVQQIKRCSIPGGSFVRTGIFCMSLIHTDTPHEPFSSASWRVPLDWNWSPFWCFQCRRGQLQTNRVKGFSVSDSVQTRQTQSHHWRTETDTDLNMLYIFVPDGQFCIDLCLFKPLKFETTVLCDFFWQPQAVHESPWKTIACMCRSSVWSDLVTRGQSLDPPQQGDSPRVQHLFVYIISLCTSFEECSIKWTVVRDTPFPVCSLCSGPNHPVISAS